MAQNFLYKFEFLVDDLLITRPNHCAPEEYPTCCEISFRSSVFVSICDREFGHCVDPCAPKCGKSCLFSLESPVNDEDRLLVHIYKKKTERCKFLVGATDMPIKPLFDKVTKTFDIENPKWMEQLAKHTARLPDPREPNKTKMMDDDCDEEGVGRKEQMCPTGELTKCLLPLFNLKCQQTGNLVLLMRLTCNGPTIVSSFSFSRFCSTDCDKKPPCPSYKPTCPDNRAPPAGVCSLPDPCRKDEAPKKYCLRYFACNADKGCPPGCVTCEDECDRVCPRVCKSKKKRREPSYCLTPSSSCGAGDNYGSPDTCQRYFATDGKDTRCDCGEQMEEYEAAKARALRKLHYLMQKYASGGLC